MKKNGEITIKGKNITIDGATNINLKARGEGQKYPAELVPRVFRRRL
jgi:hypothetical protein